MMLGYKKLGMVLGAVAVLALLPARADAQFVRYSPVFWAVEGSGGITIPMGDLGDVADPGLALGVAGSYFLNPRFALRVEGGLSSLEPADGAGVDPDMRMWSFMGGFEYHITDPTSSTFLIFDMGAGGVMFDTDVFSANGYTCTPRCAPSAGARSTGNFDNTYFGLNGGLQLGYNFAPHGATGTPMATIFIGADITFAFADEDDSSLLTTALNGDTAGFGTAMAMPITAGLRLNVP